MYCSKCNNKIEIKAFYCPRCGHALEKEPLEPNEFRTLQFHIKRLERNEVTCNIAGFTSIVTGLLISLLTSNAPWLSGIFFSFAGICSIALLIYEFKIRKCKRELMLLWYPPDLINRPASQEGKSS